ncbi:hypothetical protein IFM89_015148 [Coptis chinensis]|uniref:Protein kinase domain-containing protein n=1 Tax=Coptis chinensis TaxID=261450 RepID=A0A835HV00_9MAGN|nr:hypothetical protein IFM89_015148 [Coptis chinensis]
MLFLQRHRSASLLPPVFSYEELDLSTNCFDPRRKIGDGGFGSVYLGQLIDNRIVAVKKLHKPPQTMARTNSEKAFCNEILILSSIEHQNLVKLHGYCSDSRGLLLVYDYVPNGTLADHLHGSKSLFRKGCSLKWLTRVDIALQTSLAIEYLHFEVKPAIVHRDITSSNIFVEKDMRIKLGDFGLSRLLNFSESSGSGFICTGPQGTPGYLDPDYHRSFRLTEKSDVYSFGVVLFELISGMRAVDLGRDKREVALADLVVSKIQGGCLHQVVDPVLIIEGEAMGTIHSMAELAFRCVAADKDDRPDAKEVVVELKRIKNRIKGHRGFNISGDTCKVAVRYRYHQELESLHLLQMILTPIGPGLPLKAPSVFILMKLRIGGSRLHGWTLGTHGGLGLEFSFIIVWTTVSQLKLVPFDRIAVQFIYLIDPFLTSLRRKSLSLN